MGEESINGLDPVVSVWFSPYLRVAASAHLSRALVAQPSVPAICDTCHVLPPQSRLISAATALAALQVVTTATSAGVPHHWEMDADGETILSHGAIRSHFSLVS